MTQPSPNPSARPGDRPAVACTGHHTGLSVPDVMEAVRYYCDVLGFEEGFTWGDPVVMAGVDLGEARIFLERGTPSPAGCSLYFMVDDADLLHAHQAAMGARVVHEPGDREYGLRDYVVRDLHGYTLAFGHPIYTMGEPIPVERVDVSVRLEKRLAALLHDLASHKGMTVGQCLEETLLHTFEPVGDGVASPHTRSQLRHIEALKERHGIDYECHASYRFVEE